MSQEAMLKSPTVVLSTTLIKNALNNFCKNLGFNEKGHEKEQALILFMLMRRAYEELIENEWEDILNNSEQGYIPDINDLLSQYILDSLGDSHQTEAVLEQ